MHQDYRKLLDEKGIDALIIAHARPQPGAAVHPRLSGRQRHLRRKTAELDHPRGRTMVQAVRKYRRVLQVGSQQRSMAMNRIASQFVSGGGLGKISRVKAFNYASPDRIPNLPTEPDPRRSELGRWLGQAEFHGTTLSLPDLGVRGGTTPAVESPTWAATGSTRSNGVGDDETGPVEGLADHPGREERQGIVPLPPAARK